MKRKGFTLIELVVAMAIFLVLILIAFDAFNYVVLSSRYNRQVANTEQNLSIVIDQLTKELPQTVKSVDSSNPGGDNIPDPDPGTSKGCKDILTDSSKYGHLDPGETYSFYDSKQPILRFYIYDNNNIKHRITYTLGAPSSGGSYSGIPQRYWPDSHYEPCEILYSNETWDEDNSKWSGTQDQPVTEQVITNFTVIRPSWSDKVVQIIIEAMVKGPTGKGKAHTIRYIAQVTLRQ